MLTADFEKQNQQDSLDQTSQEQALLGLFNLAQDQFEAEQYEHAIDYLKLILERNAQHPDANHLLAKILMKLVQYEMALPYMEICLQASPANQVFWATYLELLVFFDNAEVLQQAYALRDEILLKQKSVGDIDAAVEDSMTILPQFPPAMKVLNSRKKTGSKKAKKRESDAFRQLVALFEDKKFEELQIVSKKMIAENICVGFAWRFLGMVLLGRGMLIEAKQALGYSIALLPNDATSHFNYALTCVDLKEYELAEHHYWKAIKLDGTFTAAYNNLGNLLKNLGKLEDAELVLRILCKLNPSSEIPRLNLVSLLVQKKALPMALEEALEAVKLFPKSAALHNALGSIFFLLKRHEEAIPHLLESIALNPEFGDAYNNLGSLYFDQKKYSLAKPLLERAIHYSPKLSAAYCCLAQMYREEDHDFEKAIRLLQQALVIEPGNHTVNTRLLFMLSENDQLSPEEIFREHVLYGERQEKKWSGTWQSYLSCRDKKKKLRIGFVSGDFFNHAVLSFFEPILASLAREVDIELLAYYSNDIEDEKTKAMMLYFSSWKNIMNLNDELVFNLIHEDQVDILVDLSGHTANNRLPLFARKPAPVTATWIGYPGTTGLQAMDYFIADKYYIPHGRFDHLFTEKMAYLPCAATFQYEQDLPDVSLLPALKNDHVTFASFNRISKITPKTLKIWASLLQGVKGSRILLGGMPPNQDLASLSQSFETLGISRDRIDFYGRTSISEYLELHNRVDICLDTFPYNGGTTIHHSLTMGVPTLSIDGKYIAARSSAAILGQVGLQEFLALDEIDFVRKGIYWSTHLNELADLRANLRVICAESRKSKPEELAIYLKDAFRWMWENWCDGSVAKTFTVGDL